MSDKVWVPLMRSLITSLLAMAFAAAWFIPSVIWKLAFVGLSGISLLCWLLLVWPKSSPGELSRRREKVHAHGLLKPTETTRIQITATDPASAFTVGRYANLPITHNQLVQVARRIEAGASFSLSSLGGKGKPLSRTEFENFRDYCIETAGLAYWIDPNAHAQGVGITLAGERLFKHYASLGGNGMVTPLPQQQEKVTGSLLSLSAAHARKRARDNKILAGRD